MVERHQVDNPKEAMPPPAGYRRQTWLTLVLGAVILLSGIGIGVGATLIFMDAEKTVETGDTTSSSQEMPMRIASSISEELGLDRETEQAVRAMVEERHRAIWDIRKNASEEIRLEVEKWKEEMEQILPPDKYEQWEQRVDELSRRRGRPFRRRGHGRHRPGPHSGKPHSMRKGPGFGPGMMERLFETRDKNGDGNLAGEEVPGFLWERIRTADKNGDDRISREEYGAFQRTMRKHWGTGGPRPFSGRRERRGDHQEPDGSPESDGDQGPDGR